MAHMTSQAFLQLLKGFLRLKEAETEHLLLLLVSVCAFPVPTCGQSKCKQRSVKCELMICDDISAQCKCRKSLGKCLKCVSSNNNKLFHPLSSVGNYLCLKESPVWPFSRCLCHFSDKSWCYIST